MPVLTPKKIPKPYPTYPLFAHACGSWKAKIDGRQIAFGATRSPSDVDGYRKSWQDALDRFHAFLEARARGQAIAANPFDVELKEVINAYLADKHERTESGEIDVRTFAEARHSLTGYAKTLGGTTRIHELEADPEPIRRYLKDLRKRLGIHAYNRTVRSISAMWNWAGSPTKGMLGRPFKWVELHEIRSVREVRRQQRTDRADGVLRSWSVPEILAMLEHAEQPLKSAVLLGYFAAYGNTDIAELPDNALTVYEQPQAIHFHGRTDHVPAGWGQIYFPRPKTEMDRYALVPPIVIESLKEMRTTLKSTPATRKLMFRTRAGTPMLVNNVRRDDAGLIKDVTVTDNLGKQFTRLIERLGRCEEHGIVERKPFVRGDAECPTCGKAITLLQKRGFYCLRHTSTTFASSSGASSDARSLFEGHATGGVRQAFYLEPSEMHDLLLITRELLSRLNVVTQTPGSASPAQASAEVSPAGAAPASAASTS